MHLKNSTICFTTVRMSSTVLTAHIIEQKHCNVFVYFMNAIRVCLSYGKSPNSRAERVDVNEMKIILIGCFKQLDQSLRQPYLKSFVFCQSYYVPNCRFVRVTTCPIVGYFHEFI